MGWGEGVEGMVLTQCPIYPLPCSQSTQVVFADGSAYIQTIQFGKQRCVKEAVQDPSLLKHDGEHYL